MEYHGSGWYADSHFTMAITARDLDTLGALEWCPLTVRQIEKLSETFADPFPRERKVQRRLQALAAYGLIRQWRYATQGFGAPSYYVLSRNGYRYLHGPDETLPSHRTFDALSGSRQQHTRALADCIVHVAVAAKRARCTIAEFHREGSLRLQLGTDALYPDCTFRLISPHGLTFDFFTELDNATEPIRSSGSLTGWQRKVAFYERYQDARAERFRVLAVTTGGEGRLRNLLACAAEFAHNPQRSLIYGISLNAFLTEPQAATTTCFRNHRGEAVALVHDRSQPIPPTDLESGFAATPWSTANESWFAASPR